MLSKANDKTRLTQNKREKNTINVKSKTRRGEREKVTKSLGAFFFPHLRRTFPFCNDSVVKGRIETVQA